MWTAKQLKNDSVDGEHFIRFPEGNAVCKFIRLCVDVVSVNFVYVA